VASKAQLRNVITNNNYDSSITHIATEVADYIRVKEFPSSVQTNNQLELAEIHFKE